MIFKCFLLGELENIQHVIEKIKKLFIFCIYLFSLNNSVIDLTEVHPSPAGHMQAAPCCDLLFLKFNGISMRILLLEIIIFIFLNSCQAF